MADPEINDIVYIINMDPQYPRDVFQYKYAQVIMKYTYGFGKTRYNCKTIMENTNTNIFLTREQFVFLDQRIEG